MRKMRQVLIWTIACLLMSCASPPVVQVPAGNVVESSQGDYGAYVQAWMGRMLKSPNPMIVAGISSDAYVIPIGDDAAGIEQLKALNRAYFLWCTRAGGEVMLRDETLAAPGRAIRVCEATSPASPRSQPLAAMRITFETRTEQGAPRNLRVDHWYPPGIEALGRDAREREAAAQSRMAANAERLKQERASALAERRAKDRVALEQLTTAARSKPTPQCAQFERESNALKARFLARMERAALSRYLSDLAVSFDECSHARPGPTTALLNVYRFNLQSFQLFSDAWDRTLLACDEDGKCRVDDRTLPDQTRTELGRLQAQYAAIVLSPPERIGEILERIQRFALER